MIAIKDECRPMEANWQPNFVDMLPEIEQRLRLPFVTSMRRHARMPSKKASCIRYWPMFDCMSRAERKSQ